MIILDTSYLIDFFRDASLVNVIPDGEQGVVSVISYYEILAGTRRLRSQKEEKFFHHFFADTEILEFTLPAARIAGDISGRMASQRNRVNAFDILIAGIAVAHHARGIITADQDFHEIAKYSGLEVWEYERK